jgi:glycyl-radical enzyme activating protein
MRSLNLLEMAALLPVACNYILKLMTKTGLIFDIQRTSLHDGPGIRTTVFFKGCPLQCLWCHNPESRSYKPQVSFNWEKCVSCLSCLEVCEQGAHQIAAGSHHMAHALCVACGTCLPYCTAEALKMIGEELTVEQIMAEVERDIDFYEHSGGGITLSGGEPMGQFDFAVEILRASRERGIHTCVETSGFAPQRKYQDILPLVDIFLLDYKVTEQESSQKLIGVPNGRILSNLDFLYNQGAVIILRCPLIPGLNDTPEHLAGIAKLSEQYPRLAGIEIMAYHDLGRDKGLRLGQEYQLNEIENADESTKQSWLNTLAALGCKRAKIG